MSKQVYISSDYSESQGDREVVEKLMEWVSDKRRSLDFVDMARKASGSISTNNPDCRACELKAEFNSQINASSAVIFVVGDKTKERNAGAVCSKASGSCFLSCTPYKQNYFGMQSCKYQYYNPTENGDVNVINNYSYLRHEFEQAKKQDKKIIIIYNSMYNQSSWLPDYMSGYSSVARPFWIKDLWGNRVGNYDMIKRELGYV